MDKLRKAIFMFVDLFGLERYNFEKLVKKCSPLIVVVKSDFEDNYLN